MHTRTNPKVKVGRPLARRRRGASRENQVAVTRVEGAETLTRPWDGAEALDAPNLEAVALARALHLRWSAFLGLRAPRRDLACRQDVGRRRASSRIVFVDIDGDGVR